MANTATYQCTVLGRRKIKQIQVNIGTTGTDIDIPITAAQNVFFPDDGVHGQLRVVGIIPPTAANVNAIFSSKNNSTTDYSSHSTPISGSQLTAANGQNPIFSCLPGSKLSVQTSVACIFTLLVEDVDRGWASD